MLVTSAFFLASPLEQFEILNLGAFFFFTSNAQYFLVFSVALLVFFYYHYTTQLLIIPATTQHVIYVLELIYKELMILVFRNIGMKVGQLYFSWLVFIFLLIVILNLVGMIPFAFTITSQIILTFTLSFTLFMGINIKVFITRPITWWGLFLPSGASGIIIPFLIVIEMISYTARVFSLAIRLFANMMAGHSLLKILIGFSFTIAMQNLNNWPLLIVALIPFFLVFLITFLEMAIALLQGYVFTVLMCLYIKELYVAH